MASSLIQVRINQKDKKEADKLLEELGLDMGTAVRMFVKQILSVGGLPFNVLKNKKSKEFYDNNFYNETNVKMIKESIEQLNNGGGTYRELIDE